MTKEELLLKECVYPYHEMFQDQAIAGKLKQYEPTLRALSLKLTEEAMAHASDGLYKWTDDHWEDYDDHSDQKTGTMKPRYHHGGGLGEIAGLTTFCGNEKNGAIRAIIHNQFTNRLDYFFFPKKIWTSFGVEAPNGKLRLRFSYSGYEDKYVYWAEENRVKTFKELSLSV